jgi:hypothetical protein
VKRERKMQREGVEWEQMYVENERKRNYDEEMSDQEMKEKKTTENIRRLKRKFKMRDDEYRRENDETRRVDGDYKSEYNSHDSSVGATSRLHL